MASAHPDSSFINNTFIEPSSYYPVPVRYLCLPGPWAASVIYCWCHLDGGHPPTRFHLGVTLVSAKYGQVEVGKGIARGSSYSPAGCNRGATSLELWSQNKFCLPFSAHGILECLGIIYYGVRVVYWVEHGHGVRKTIGLNSTSHFPATWPSTLYIIVMSSSVKYENSSWLLGHTYLISWVCDLQSGRTVLRSHHNG